MQSVGSAAEVGTFRKLFCHEATRKEGKRFHQRDGRSRAFSQMQLLYFLSYVSVVVVVAMVGRNAKTKLKRGLEYSLLDVVIGVTYDCYNSLLFFFF